MTPHKKISHLVLLASFTVSAVGPIHGQVRRTTTTSTPSYTPPVSHPTQTQSQPAPQRSYQTPQRQTPPPAAQRQSAPVVQRQTAPAPQPERTPAPQTRAPSQVQSPTSNGKHPGPQVPEASHPQPSLQQSPKERKEEARRQKENLKQAQKAQKEEARRQKEEAKQQQKQQKEQARLDKERIKNEKKNQKQPGGEKVPAGVPAKEPAGTKPEAPYHMPPGAISGRTRGGSVTLTREGSQSVIQQVNSARSRMSGNNRKPLPTGDVTVHPNGRLTVNAAGGRQYGVRSDGTISSYRDNTKTVNFDHGGRVSSLNTANLEVRRGAGGGRTIISRRADNSRLVSTGLHSGYVERNVVIGNQSFIQRTTLINQTIVTRNYVAFNYASVRMAWFVTPVFYAPAFYGWAFYPWPAPIPFTFGWMGAPWYVGPYPYFTAYPVYPSAAFWLTDYLLGETLATAYQLHADKALAAEAIVDGDDDSSHFDTLQADATTPITPELKAAIAEEVKQELSYDSAASAAHNQETGYDEVSSVLGSPNHIFVVSDDMDVTTVDENSCGLQAGDILQLESAPTRDSALASLRVASSKKTDCPAGVVVTVSVLDLQDMHNNFRAQVEAGLGALQSGQGHNGLPVAPPAAVAAPPRPTLADGTAPSSADMNAMFESQRQQADQAEEQAQGSAF